MNNVNTSWEQDFKQNTIFRIDESMRMITKSLEITDESDIWKKPNSSSNSIGNLILHLCGNITQYIIASLGSKPDIRERDLEFSITGGVTKKNLLSSLIEVIEESKNVIASASKEELMRIREVQGFKLSGIGVVIHVVEHLSYHTGQIAYWVKLLKDRDLGFYDGFDLNTINE